MSPERYKEGGPNLRALYLGTEWKRSFGTRLLEILFLDYHSGRLGCVEGWDVLIQIKCPVDEK